MSPAEAAAAERRTHQRLWAYARPHKGSLLLSVGAFLLASATEPLIPKLLQTALDEGFLSTPAFPLWMVPVALIGLFMMRGVFGFIGQYMMNRGMSRAVLALREDLAGAVLRAEAGVFSHLPPGVVVTKVINDPQAISHHLGGGLITVLRDGTTALALIAYLLWLNWSLTLLSLVSFPLLMWAVRVVHKRMKRVGGEQYQAQSRLAALTEEVARSWRVIRTFGAEGFELERFKDGARQVQRMLMKTAAAAATMTPISQMAASVGVALIVMLAMHQVRSGQGTVGAFVGYIAALLLLVSRVRHLTDVSQSFISARVVADGCFELLDLPAEADTGTQVLAQPARGEIAFDAVTVAYPGAAEPALQGFSFRIEAGRTVALVGASGAGKSTVVGALLGFVTPQSGRILLDGQPIERLTRASLRRQFAVVSQDTVLFDGTVADNIIYALPRDDARLQECLQAAALADTVAQLPQGLDSEIGVNGSKLSGGQRQRLSIARAMYKDAPVWIFDEATSALDSESEHAIQQALKRWHGTKTMVLIAHRLSTVAHADLILVMEAGRVVQAGSHAELAAQEGPYARALGLQSAARAG